MAKPLAYDFGVNASLEGERRVGMPQVVKADTGQGCRLDVVVEGAGEMVGVYGLAVLLTEHEVLIAIARPEGESLL